MKKTIICLAGRKRTGKETVYKILYPNVLKPEEFQFATPLKRFCIDVLGLTHQQCYGNDAERESLTKYQWKDIASHICNKYGKNLDDYLTARDVLQVVGTDLMREQFYRNVWAEAGVREAINSKATTCVYTDTRFINEIEAIINLSYQNDFAPPLICRLFRQTGLQDPHSSESSLDSQDLYPNQRGICEVDYSHLEDLGYQQVLPNLWQGDRSYTYYDYLIDNNFSLENLKKAVTLMLNTHGIYHELNLS